MNYLLDTCVISEYTKKQPASSVLEWVAGSAESELFLSVLSIGEIMRGIERLSESQRKTELQTWLNDDLRARFGNRLVVIDVDVMLAWGALTSRLEKTGRILPFADSLIAATALRHNFILATRNVSDFADTGVQIINPW
jgi:predicted nucleic acid-binding protein